MGPAVKGLWLGIYGFRLRLYLLACVVESQNPAGNRGFLDEHAEIDEGSPRVDVLSRGCHMQRCCGCEDQCLVLVIWGVGCGSWGVGAGNWGLGFMFSS